MDGQQRPISSCDSVQQRALRFATIFFGALICSAVVGAVGVKPSAKSPFAPPASRAEALPAFEPVEMVPIDIRTLEPAPPARLAQKPAIRTASPSTELLKDAVIKPPMPARATAGVPVLPPTMILPRRVARVIRMEVTAYCHCIKCCGPAAQGVTASGKPVTYNGGLFVAADTAVLPFGAKLVIPGYANNAPVEVIDRGGAIRGNKLDVYYPDHEIAKVWGRRWVDVMVLE